MKKILIGIAVLIVGFIAFIATIAIVPSAYAPLLEFSCVKDGKSTSESCNNRIRALGHLQSKHGDLEAAAKWYEFAANNDDEVAMFHLGWTYYTYTHSIMLQWSAAATSGDVNEVERLQALRQDTYRQAFEWFERSAILGFAPSMNNLAHMYTYGYGTERSSETALQWKLDAADLNNPAAYMNLVFAYHTGIGGVLDGEIATSWSEWRHIGDDFSNVASPTLKRSFVAGTPIPSEQADQIRAVAQDGGYFRLNLRPNPGDPTFSTFPAK